MNKRHLLAVLCAATTTLCAISTSTAAATQGDGVQLGASYTQDYMRNVQGGLQRGVGAPGMINLNATIDGSSWGGSGEDMLYLDLLETTGSSISNRVGDLQGLDNVEAHDTGKIYAAWYQHRFAGSGVSLRLGLQDYNALFDALDPAALFINSSFGIDPTISQTTVSIFPTTTAGAVLRWEDSSGLYAMAGVYDGKPGRPGHPNGTQLAWQGGDGTFSAFEAGATGDPGQRWKLALGGWYHYSAFRDPEDRVRHHNHGVYAIGSRRLLGSDTHLPAVDAFVQLGAAEANRNILNRYIGAGLEATGLLPSRPHDVLGVAMARAHTGRAYRRITAGAAPAETVLELTWSTPISRHFSLQPDLQYIIDPSAQSTIDNALALGFRMQFSW